MDEQITYEINVDCRWWGRLIGHCWGVIQYLPGIRRVAYWCIIQSATMTDIKKVKE